MILLLIAGCAPTPVREQTQTVFYPGLPDTPRIQFLTAITSEEDIGVERNRFREFVTGKSDSIMALARPWDLDHTHGKLYVSDKTFRRIVVVNLESKRMELVDKKNDLPFRAFDLLHYVLHSLLELAAIFRTSDHEPEIEREDDIPSDDNTPVDETSSRDGLSRDIERE